MKLQADRLQEMIQECRVPIHEGFATVGERGFREEDAYVLSRYLIERGVILPPCKVGDTVYFKDGRKGVVTSFYCCDSPDAGNLWVSIDKKGYRDNVFRTNVCVSDFGVTVFLNPKEIQL